MVDGSLACVRLRNYGGNVLWAKSSSHGVKTSYSSSSSCVTNCDNDDGYFWVARIISLRTFLVEM